MLPPGLANVAISAKAQKVMEGIKSPGVYLDLKAYIKKVAENDTPHTPAVTLIRGMKVAVDMINAVGIENLWKRTALLAKATRESAKAIGMEVFSKQPSDSVTGLLYPEGIDDKFRKHIEAKYGLSMAGGQDHMKGKLVRLSHMGYVDPLDTLGMVAAIEYTLADLGVNVEIGKGVATAAKVLRDWK
jgi:aspartate aminotransferase-like enzyme